MKTPKKKKKHVEYRWVNLYQDDNCKPYFGGMTSHNKRDLCFTRRIKKAVRVKMIEQ